MAKAPANPAVLKWAREALNIPIEDVARRLRRDPKEVAAWEAGQSQPTYVQLETLAHKVYQRPVAVFFFPEPPDEEKLKESFRTLPEFEIKRLSASVIKVVRRAQAMQLELRELCQGTCPAPRKVLQDVTVAGRSSAPAVGATLREYLGIPIAAQVAWRSRGQAFAAWRETLEASGVFVFKDAFRQDEISGFCLFDEEFPLICVNNSLSWSRQIFTLFHELAHLLFRTGGIDKLQDDYIEDLRPTDRRVEVFCNTLAGAFLVPDADFDERSRHLRLDENQFSKLADTYSVSREVILRKLLDRGRVSEEVYDRLSSKWIGEARRQRASAKGGDYYATRRAYLSNRYLDLALGAYYRKAIDIHRLAELLNMKVDTAREFESRL